MPEHNYDAIRESICRRYGALPFPEKSYIILMSPRSGSNLLCAHLNKINFGNPIEAFHNPKNLRKLYGWEIDFSDPYQRFKKAMEFQTTAGVFGMKMNWDQFNYMIGLGRQLIDEDVYPLSDAAVVEVFFPNLSFIRLKRKNKVKQAISYSKGMQTGIWVIPAGGLGRRADFTLAPKYDRDHIEVCLEKLLSYHFLWEEFLARHQIKPLEIWYEDLAANFVETLKGIYRYLGIESEDFPAPQTRKIADKQTDDWLERFISETPWLADDEIKQAFSEGDFSSAFTRRYVIYLSIKEDQVFFNASFNRFKKLRYYWMRLNKKLSKLGEARHLNDPQGKSSNEPDDE